MLMSFDEVCSAVNGQFLARYSAKNGFQAVATDSRNCVEDSLFVPLRGLTCDGHRFIAQALQQGAVCVFADTAFIQNESDMYALMSLCKDYQAVCIIVENTLAALQAAAKCYIARFPQLVKIGITGSNGKTTTKELLGSIFSQKYTTIINKGNLNSETGLPLSVFEIREYHEIGIFEMGMNRKGEIAELAAILQPDIAVITNIGTAHIGMLGSKDAIAAEKKEIFSYFTEVSAGFVPETDEYVDFLKKTPRGRIFTYGAADSVISHSLHGTTIIYKNIQIDFPLLGKHNVQNAFAAIAVAEYYGIPLNVIKTGLEKAQPLFGRSQLITAPSLTYLLDCYNANPDSMQAGLAFCATLPDSYRKVYVLGSMKELGEESEAAHYHLCNAAAETDAAALFLFGKELCSAWQQYSAQQNTLCVDCEGTMSVFCFLETEADACSRQLDAFLQKGDFVFLKGSRSMQLEQFAPVLQKERY
ncbi:MAG: UDP-N-acetylmuramoyl-tripeptide--D-alanyl-D-alanine ligase [Treponema sp.]